MSCHRQACFKQGPLGFVTHIDPVALFIYLSRFAYLNRPYCIFRVFKLGFQWCKQFGLEIVEATEDANKK